MLNKEILAVGVFVNETIDTILKLVNERIIDVIQLHGNETKEYIKELKSKTDCQVIKAFRIISKEDIKEINECNADYVLLDSGAGTGKVFEWDLIEGIERPFFLAGGLDPDNVKDAIRKVKPFAVDVSSGIETDGIKDEKKMITFVENVRRENNYD